MTSTKKSASAMLKHMGGLILNTLLYRPPLPMRTPMSFIRSKASASSAVAGACAKQSGWDQLSLWCLHCAAAVMSECMTIFLNRIIYACMLAGLLMLVEQNSYYTHEAGCMPTLGSQQHIWYNLQKNGTRLHRIANKNSEFKLSVAEDLYTQG